MIDQISSMAFIWQLRLISIVGVTQASIEALHVM